jgi:hypothetical protein
MPGMTRGDLAGFAGLAGATLGGLAFMELGGAPPHYPAVNAAALGLGGGVFLLVSRAGGNGIGRGPALAIVMLSLVLFGASLAGPEVDGVHRWLRIGPLSLHAGMLVMPTLAVLLPRCDSRIAFSAVSISAVLAAIQPDTASALAVAALAAGAFLGARNRWNLAAALVATIGFGVTCLQRGDLQTVRFVESVVRDAVAMHPLVGSALAALAILAIGAPMRAMPVAREFRAAHFAWAGCLSGYFLASLIGPYPTPLIGYGASPIIGFAIGLALLKTRASASAHTVEDCPNAHGDR